MRINSKKREQRNSMRTRCGAGASRRRADHAVLHFVRLRWTFTTDLLCGLLIVVVAGVLVRFGTVVMTIAFKVLSCRHRRGICSGLF